jgi:hypothetical protein
MVEHERRELALTALLRTGRHAPPPGMVPELQQSGGIGALRTIQDINDNPQLLSRKRAVHAAHKLVRGHWGGCD